MGATITTGKQAGAFVANGKVLYVLFEESYEKNCYPHTPRWSAWVAGTPEQVMQRIFLAASDCEGGMLQSKAGYITPESWIRGWLKEMAAPREIPESTVLRFNSFGLGDTAMDACRKVGDLEAVEAMQKNLTIRRQVGSDTSLAMMEAGVPTWKLGLDIHMLGEVAEHLGYRPEKNGPSPIAPPAFCLLADNYGDMVLERSESGYWRSLGESYRAVGGFVRSLWQNELKHPGTSPGLIKAWRDAMKDASYLASDALVRFNAIYTDIPDYYVDTYIDLRKKLGVDAGMKLPLSEVKARLNGDTYRLFSLCEIESEQPLISFEGEPGIAAPKYQEIKAEPGMVVEIGGTSYRLIASLGRKGWQVARISDEVVFRAPSKEVASALRALSDKAFNQAREAVFSAAVSSQAVQSVAVTVEATQASLF
jgi:hypothetical protein